MPPRRSWRRVLATLLVTTTAVVTAVVLLSDERYVAPAPPPAATGVDAGAAATALVGLAEALSRGDEPAAAALAPAGDGAAGDLLGALAGNAARLRVGEVTLRFVDQVGVLGQDGSWTARVDLAWELRGRPTGPARARSEVEVGLRQGEGSVAVTGFTGGRVPLWLRGPVQVERGAGTVVVTAGRDPAPYAAMAARALPQVRRVLPDVGGDLVVEVPDSSAELDAVLGVPEGTYRAVAAVTASVDGSTAESAPVHVFVNPQEFDRLRRTGAQVVMTHEAVHALTGAPTSRAPVWLVEGFADYVALRDVEVPLSRTAAQVLAQVRREGAPDRLPGEAEFDVTAPHLGAAYEAAWLACRALVELSSEEALLAVYDAAGAGTDVESALREETGVDLATLTDRWRQLLLDAAGSS